MPRAKVIPLHRAASAPEGIAMTLGLSRRSEVGDGAAAALAEPEAEAGEEDRAHGELQRDGSMCGREEGFERARDDGHGDGAGDELHAFRAAEGDGVPTA